LKQAVMAAPGQVDIVDVDLPKIGANQILVKVKNIGVCGSDIHVWHGKHPTTSYPVVQGHEVSAVITAVGSKVSNLDIGNAVTVQPQVVCGKCYPCTHGMYNDCEVLKVMGFQTMGMASEYFAVDANKVLKLPQGMSFEHGAMIEPLAVAIHAIGRFGSVSGKNVMVIGGGPIGNLVAQSAKALGAAKVLISEISEFRLAIASKCNIPTVNPNNKKLYDAILQTFGSNGADVIFECIGSPHTIKEAVDIARKGSDIIIVGVVSEPCEVDFGFVQDHELRVTGSAMYRVEDFIEAIRLIDEGLVELDALITHRVPFVEYESAYRMFEKQKEKAMKIMIEMEE